MRPARTLRTLLPLTAPLVTAWAAWHRARVMARGRALDERERRIAAAVGVAQPDRIRLLAVQRMPIPAARWIDALARRIGLPAADVDGITLGHAILVRADVLDDMLLAHECRHVHQCEAAGSMRRFLLDYLRQVARHGYRDAPFEADARTHAVKLHRHLGSDAADRAP